MKNPISVKRLHHQRTQFSNVIITRSLLVLITVLGLGHQWYLDGNPIGGATNQNYAATASGNYTVGVTDDNDCSSAPSAPVGVTVTATTALTVVNVNDSGAGSLRQAIADICDGGTIDFNIPDSGPDTITLTSGELLIDKNLTIQGPGADQLTVMRSAAGGTPLFRLFTINPSKTVAISGLTMINGSLPGNGGGVLNNGTLTLTNCTVTGNTSSIQGGGVSNAIGGTLTIVGSTISGNSSSAGSGVFNAGTVTLINSTMSGNTGDGLANGTSATANLTNDTVANNSIRGITSNPGATTNIRNTIVVGTPGTVGDVQGIFNSQGNNLIGKSDGSDGFTNGGNNDQVGTIAAPLNALLAALGNYGGPTRSTMSQSLKATRARRSSPLRSRCRRVAIFR